MFTKLPHSLRRVSVRPYANKVHKTAHTSMSDLKWLEIQSKAVQLEYLEYIKQNTSQQDRNIPVKQTISPKEAAGKVLDDAFSKIRHFLGDTFTNIIEHPLRALCFSQFERIFTYLAKDGRVDKETANDFSKYALYLIAALTCLYIYEEITSRKDEISKLEREIEELKSQYTIKTFAHGDIRDQIIEKQQRLLSKKEQLTNYLDMVKTLEEAKAGVVKEAEDCNFLGYIKDQFFSMLNSDGYEKVKVKSFLSKQNKEQSVAKEIDKWASVDVAVMVAEEHVSKINKKCNSLQATIVKLEQKLDIVGEQVVQIGKKMESKESQLTNKWGYSLFKQIKQEVVEAPTNENKFEI
ncbi:hypothetical protein [Legionella saoudiensis]|uniref:hypothetical protein n=1 Tax=Legionella saoudiensis TaxID=1750561 RepID=UPI00072FA41D|nr:hypothetical protein [Legionella saoudiensis]